MKKLEFLKCNEAWVALKHTHPPRVKAAIRLLEEVLDAHCSAVEQARRTKRKKR